MVSSHEELYLRDWEPHTERGTTGAGFLPPRGIHHWTLLWVFMGGERIGWPVEGTAVCTHKISFGLSLLDIFIFALRREQKVFGINELMHQVHYLHILL